MCCLISFKALSRRMTSAARERISSRPAEPYAAAFARARLAREQICDLERAAVGTIFRQAHRSYIRPEGDQGLPTHQRTAIRGDNRNSRPGAAVLHGRV